MSPPSCSLLHRFDLLSGGTAARVVEAETYVTTAGPVIKFGKKCHAECAAFSPDGQFLVSGSIDGFLEVGLPPFMHKNARHAPRPHIELSCVILMIFLAPIEISAQVWDYERGKLRKDLAYQEQDNLMMHDEPVRYSILTN